MTSIVKVDTIQENTSANGITVDGLNIKDSKLVTSNSVVTANITDANVTLAKLAGDSVDATKIADNAISEEHLDVTSITGHTAETSIADGDTILIHDASASALRKMTKANFVSGIGGTNTPFFLANVTTGQTLASGTNTKVTGFADIYDTSNTFASNRFTPAVAGYYYLEGSVSINTPNSSTYLQSQIYKNGSLIAWSQQIQGSGGTALVTASIIDLADDNDYYEMYIRQNSGGDIDTNTNADTKYNRFLGYKLIT